MFVWEEHTPCQRVIPIHNNGQLNATGSDYTATKVDALLMQYMVHTVEHQIPDCCVFDIRPSN